MLYNLKLFFFASIGSKLLGSSQIEFGVFPEDERLEPNEGQRSEGRRLREKGWRQKPGESDSLLWMWRDGHSDTRNFAFQKALQLQSLLKSPKRKVVSLIFLALAQVQ